LGLAIGVSVLAQGTARAVTDSGPCSALPNPVYVSGSSAVKPVLAGLSQAVKDTATIVYFGNGSCTGVAAALGAAQTATTTAVWWSAPLTAGGDPVENNCDVATTQAVDVGVSDVFATSCAGVTADMVKAANVGDFDTFFAQVMEFVVPINSDQTSISAEAAYLTFGLGDQGATP